MRDEFAQTMVDLQIVNTAPKYNWCWFCRQRPATHPFQADLIDASGWRPMPLVLAAAERLFGKHECPENRDEAVARSEAWKADYEAKVKR